MPTRSEQFRANEQRHASKKSKKKATEHATKKSRVKRKAKAHENVRAGKKATFALEPKKPGARPSRKSSRKSANRAKFDTNIELRGERTKATPTARYRGGK
jgi:hypothetical protein